MNPELQALEQMLQLGNSAKGNLAGLDEQYATADALRTRGNTKANKYGYDSPFQALADNAGRAQGHIKAREVAPQREQARADVAKAASALPMYQASVNADKVVQDQENFTGAALAKVSAAQQLAEAKASAKNAPESWVDTDGSNNVTGFMTDSGFVGENGQLIDISTKVPYKEYATSIKDAGGAGVGKLSNKDRQTARDGIRAVDATYGAMSNMTENDRAEFNNKGSQAKNLLIKGLSPTSFEPIAESLLSGYSPRTQKMLVYLNAMSAQERNRLFGGALTAPELASSQSFLPAVMGRGLEWMAMTLEKNKRGNTDRLNDLGDGEWLRSNGIIGDDYAAEAYPINHDPLAAPAPESAPSPMTGLEFEDAAEEAAYQQYLLANPQG